VELCSVAPQPPQPLTMGSKVSIACVRPEAAAESPLDVQSAQDEVRPQGGVRGRFPQKPMTPEYHSDVHEDKPALVSGLVHAHHISKFDKKYDLSDSNLLGRGTQGVVCTVKSRATGDIYALKEISLATVGGSMSSMRKEIELQKKLDHPNICKVIESFEDRKGGRMYIVMELCTGGSLVSRMKAHRYGYGEQAAATRIEKMLSAVLYCHHHGIVHRDIKLDNMMYEDEREDAELKLTDFGFARAVRPGLETMHEQLGTPSYMSPELWAEHRAPYDSSVDMWAIGVVAYMLLSGQRPFHSTDQKEKARMIREDPLQFPPRYWAHISAEAQDFCRILMQKDPAKRLSASEAVKHPWITHRSRAHSGTNGLSAAQELERHHEVVESLERFVDADDLRRLGLEVIAFNMPPCKLEELRELFQKIDIDDSGTISLPEFKQAMAKHPEISQQRCEEIFCKLDSTHSGEVDFTEFLAATLSSQRLVRKKSVQCAFGVLDSDGDGYVTRGDLEEAFSGSIAERSLGRFLRHADAEGRISYETFTGLIPPERRSSVGDPIAEEMP